MLVTTCEFGGNTHHTRLLPKMSANESGIRLHNPVPAVTDAHSGARYCRLSTSAVEVIIDISAGARPGIIYWGPTLPHTSPEELALLSTRQWAFGGANVDVSDSLSNEFGAGLAGPSGFVAHRNREDWASILTLTDAAQDAGNRALLVCQDSNTGLSATYTLEIDLDSHVLSARTTIENLGNDALTIDWCAALCLPLDRRLQSLLTFTGRWAGEFQTQEVPAFRGSVVRENKSGRTSHDNFPALVAKARYTSEKHGPAAGFHLGWSGNHRVRADRHSDGRAFVQMGELFYPGEMVLGQGERYETPEMLAAWSDNGLTRLSQRFHEHFNKHVGGGRKDRKPRPVHYNTWEAIYFDHSEERVLDLVDRAADVGAERFVLDDGWFGTRRHERSGLGDWWVAKDVYPDGLHRITDRIRERGMEFGIWFEPEMVNPDSDLFRAHPDWILAADGVEQVPFRDQYTLDLTKLEVFNYLFETISAVIAEYDVAYVKWDMNRDIQHPGSAGRGVIHRQTQAVYDLMAKLRSHFPELEIESCSSGGGRADFGVLRHADRLWLSDNNDAGDRQAIQRGASHFFPLAINGSHVGPRLCHITRRTHSMAYRAATAMFGHMGLELDLADEPEADVETLKRAIALHKQHRKLIHSGRYFRLDSSDYLNAFGVVSDDGREALFSCAKTDGHSTTLPGRFRFAGLDDATRYRMRLIWPTENVSITSPSIVERADLLGDGIIVSGEAIGQHGVQLPLMYSDTCLIYHFVAVDE